MFELIALLGGFWFIVFLLIITAIGIVAAEMDNFLLGTSSFIIALIGAQLFFGMPVWSTIKQEPLSIISYSVLYLIIGAIYTTLWRWPEYLRDRSSAIMSSFKSYNSSGTKSFSEFTKSYEYKKEYSASKHSEGICTWVITWPFSLFWELARKPIKYLYRTIYKVLGDLLERVGVYVTTSIYRNHKD